MAATCPSEAPGGESEATAFASVRGGPWTADFAKRGSVFSGPLSGPGQGKSYVAGVNSGATERTPFFPAFFFSISLASACVALRSHSCLGRSLGPGRVWSREPSCWDLARAIPRLLPRSACRRKPAAWLPRCSARALNPQAHKPGSPSALKPFRLEGDLKPYAPDALEPFCPQAFKDSRPCAVTFLSPQALQLQA